MPNELSASYSKALELHNKIVVSAQLAQNNLWEMCAGLKEMRDGKLYKELGYQNFEEYCGAEFNMSRRNAYYYISIIENMNEKNVKTFSQMGKSKLFLLSTLTESEQEKLTAENDVESMTVRQLEAEVKALKAEEDALRLRRKAFEKSVERLKAYLLGSMHAVGRLKIDMPRARLSIRKNAESLVIDDDSRFIEWAQAHNNSLLKYAQPEIRKTDAKKLVQAGEQLPFVHLTRTESLTIK